MPWDATALWIADLTFDPTTDRATESGTKIGTKIGTVVLTGAHRVVGQPEESLVQPEWAASGEPFVVSDRSGWWNIYRVAGVDELLPVHPVEAEVGEPAWVFGQSNYVVADDGTIWFAHARDGHAGWSRSRRTGRPRIAAHRSCG